MVREEHIGFAVKSLHNQLRRAMDQRTQECGLTGMQGWLLGYLYDCEQAGRDIFQRDLEQDFGIRRSTVTGVLQLMERSGLILREPVAEDARLKRLRLAEKGYEKHRQLGDKLEELERQMRRGISGDEIRMFFALAARIENNLS